MSADALSTLSSVLAGTVRLANEMKASRLVEPASGSKAEREKVEGFRAGRYRPLIEPYSMSEARLVAASGQLAAIGGLLAQGSETVHAIAALARTALESSARVAWLLDPRIDGKTRGLRSIAELMYAFREESKMPIPAFQGLGKARVEELIEGMTSLPREGLVPPGKRRTAWVTFDGRVNFRVAESLAYVDGEQTLTVAFDGRHRSLVVE